MVQQDLSLKIDTVAFQRLAESNATTGSFYTYRLSFYLDQMPGRNNPLETDTIIMASLLELRTGTVQWMTGHASNISQVYHLIREHVHMTSAKFTDFIFGADLQ